MTDPRGGGPSRSQGVSSGARGAIVIGLAVILGIVGLQILDDSGPGNNAATIATIPGVAPATGLGSVTTTVPLKPNAQVRVKVYNASGVQGTAQTMSDKLKALGYNMQTPANLKVQHTGTVVQCLEGFKREGTLLAGYGVANGATLQPYPKDPPAGASEADCIVVIGSA
jgi:hypothetical protein